MSHQCQLVRKTAAVLMACCLIARLLLGFCRRFRQVHERLTYRHTGLDFRLTGVVQAQVVKEILV
jgi:hypothetical protein